MSSSQFRPGCNLSSLRVAIARDQSSFARHHSGTTFAFTRRSTRAGIEQGRYSMIKFIPRSILIPFIFFILAFALPSTAHAQIAPTRLSVDFLATPAAAIHTYFLNLPSFDAGLAPQG